jgi:uncharacterized protein
METWELLRVNLASPVCLAFALGLVARLMRSELSLPRDLYTSLGIYLLLALGIFQMARSGTDATAVAESAEVKQVEHRTWQGQLHEVLTARSMVLLVGGLVVGYVMGEQGYASVSPFFEGMFKGALTLFLLEMGISAGARLGDLRRAGLFLVAFGVAMPVLHGFLGVLLGHWAGLSVGGCTVLATMAASASYIAAPPAVRMTLPQANPTYYLTAALAISFPFNLLFGVPLYYHLARLVAGG